MTSYTYAEMIVGTGRELPYRRALKSLRANLSPRAADSPSATSGGETTSPAGNERCAARKTTALAGLVTIRDQRRFKPTAAAWVAPGRRRLVTVLTAAPADAARLYLTGAVGGIAKLREWAMGELPDGWSAAGHYLDDTAAPVLHYARPDGRRLDVYRASQWVGDNATPADAAATLAEVDRLLRGAFGDGAYATPATTGRKLFARTIPVGVAYPVLDDETQTLIRATTGQGRIEVCPAGPNVKGLVELDGRLMYGALCRQLGAGPARRDNGNEYLDHAPARYRVAVTVPGDWAHVGLLPVMDDGGGWSYPSGGGECFDTWADGAELQLAYRHGWRVAIRERLVLDDAKASPLDKWAKTLTAIALGDVTPAVRGAIRAILLHGIGAFAGRPRTITKTGGAADVPRDVTDVQRVADDRYLWHEHAAPAWPEMSHPEWSARVWARARCRLLDGPGNTGALHLERGSVIGFLTDAIYLDHDPRWPDDGAAGRYRVKANRAGVMPAPVTMPDLVRLRDGV